MMWCHTSRSVHPNLAPEDDTVMAGPYILEIISGECAGQRFELQEGETTIGRHQSNPVCLGKGAKQVSGLHAIIRVGRDGVSVHDSRSTNGTYVNGEEVEHQHISSKDIVSLAHSGPQFRVVPADELPAASSVTGAGSHESNGRRAPVWGELGDELALAADEGTQAVRPIPPSDAEPPKKPSSNTEAVGYEPPLHGETDIEDTSRRAIHNENNDDLALSPDDDSSRPQSSDERNATSRAPSSGGDNGTSRTRSGDLDASKGRDEAVPSGDGVALTGSLSLSDVPLGYPAAPTNSSEPTKDGPPLTVEIQSRLREQMLNTGDIKILVRDNAKRGRVLADEKIGKAQRRTMDSFVKAYRTMRRTHFIIFGTAVGVALAAAIYFGVGYFRYRSILSKGLEIERELDGYERQMEKVRGKEGARDELNRLYAQLQERKSELDSVKGLLDQADHRRFYTDTVEYFIDEVMREFKETNYHVPPQMLSRVKHYIELFSGRMKSSTERIMQRKATYFPEIHRTFRRYRLPGVLAYVAMQESALKEDVESVAGALGMWQFMPATGRRFGLEVSSIMDERLDWRKSTHAAAKYLHFLISQFGGGGDVMLAIAAYNAGEGKIRRALAQIEDPFHDHDFWYLYRTSTLLAQETREYVPQIIARMIIDKHPDYYGFE
ncbi:MAG: transglycosylase SLT domain-containing protein [Chitinivibrionales bacterium]|nr:transglycosylase SLT domain-containing protein [Chitinivibrionales bacterium]MBD3356739.1 transglycosylase SLT domain-containing protein [Chitinivibrionales bacterium]